MFSKLIIGLLVIGFVVSCGVKPVVRQSVVTPLFEKDVVTLNGEGLAAWVPSHPILVNNNLIFSSMGDVVLGISMAVGARDRLIKQLQLLPPLKLEDRLAFQLIAKDISAYQSVSPYIYILGTSTLRLEYRLQLCDLEGICKVVQAPSSEQIDVGQPLDLTLFEQALERYLVSIGEEIPLLID